MGNGRLALIVLICAVGVAGEQPVDPVPRLRQEWQQLSPAEQKSCRDLFAKLNDDSFDVREGAMQQLMTRGPAVLPLADEFAVSEVDNLAAAASELRLKILTRYDGWWPVGARLQAQLERRPEKGWPRLTGDALKRPLQPLEKFAAQQGIRLIVDPRAVRTNAGFFPGREQEESPTVGEVLSSLAQAVGLDVLPRGDQLLVSSPQTIERLRRQRRVFDWKQLGLTGDDARWVTGGLEPFFPAVSTELHGSADALSVRGVVGCTERAARIIALLAKDAPEAVWPPPDPGLAFQNIVAELSKPVDTYLNNSEPLLAFRSWRKQGVVVGLWCEGKVYDEPPYPITARSMAPAKLKLKDVPLGLTLRWFSDRAQFAASQQKSLGLWPEVGSAGQVRLRIGDKRRNVLELSVAGCDVRALSWGEEAGEPADKAIEKRLQTKLRPHLELFPGLNPRRDMRVRRGRLVMQGTPSALAYALDLIREWKKNKRPPVCLWHDRIERSLDKRITWDGRGLTAGSLLRKLRAKGEFPILLVDSPHGDPPYFKLTPDQSELLPPGEHSLRELFDELAKRAEAVWAIRWGVIVLYAAPPTRSSIPGKKVEKPEKDESKTQTKDEANTDTRP